MIDNLNKLNLNQFNNINLEDLNQVKLLNRKDTKYIFHENNLPNLLNKLSSSFKILEINNKRKFFYESIYFDTDDFMFYNQHHNEKRSRFKVRFRKYDATNNVFFEIKKKNNKNRTIKKRISNG